MSFRWISIIIYLILYNLRNDRSVIIENGKKRAITFSEKNFSNQFRIEFKEFLLSNL